MVCNDLCIRGLERNYDGGTLITELLPASYEDNITYFIYCPNCGVKLEH